MHSLCIADHLGVLKSIEHIAKARHAESQPPPPPYVSYPKPRQKSKSQQSAELGSKGANLGTTTEQQHQQHCLNGETARTVGTNEFPQPSDQGTDPESSSSNVIEIATPMAEGGGLRRRRRREETSSKAVNLDSKEKVDSGTTLCTIDNSETFRNVYYGVGAGTFLF